MKDEIGNSRREFAYGLIGGFTGFVSGASVCDDEYGLYNDLNRAASSLIYGVLNSNNLDRKESYRMAHHESLDRSVLDLPVKINMVDVNFDKQKRDYEFSTKREIADSVEKTFRNQLSLEMDVDISEMDAEELKTGFSEQELFEELQDVNWATRKGKEFMGGEVLNDYLSECHRSDSVNVYLLPFDSSYIHRRAGGFGNKIVLDKRRPDVVEKLLYHDIGHSLGLFHDEESIGVMSYSPDRIMRGEFGLIEEPFREESIENWKWIKMFHKKNNPELEHFDS